MIARYKQPISHLFQRYPLLASISHRALRLVQARFTAGAVGVIFNERGEVLVLQHVYRPQLLWGLPGGYVNRREEPAHAVERELWEETGLRVRAVAPLTVSLGLFADHIDLAFLSLLDGGEIRLNAEILAHRWVLPGDLPEMGPFHRRAVEQALRMREERQWA